MPPTTQTRYANSGGLAVAYQVSGDGSTDLIFVPGFISHTELDWDVPFLAAMLERLARFSRLVVFDKRGHGLSDRSLGSGTLEDRMDDLRAVMDAAGLARAALFAMSEGGPLALLFAATYPERVSALVLYGTFARLCRAPGYDIGIEPSAIERRANRIVLVTSTVKDLVAGSGLAFEERGGRTFKGIPGEVSVFVAR
jgi:pimeloyl-ACP methyl ester carboxylesterase